MKKVGLFIDTWYPMVDGVIKVVDNYARRLTRYCDVVVFCPETRGYSREEDEKLPYKVVRCHSLPIIGYDYDLPTPVLDPVFEAQVLRSGIDIVHIHSPFSVGMAGVLYAKLHKIPAVATLHSQYRQDFEKPLHTDVAVNVAMSGIMRVFNACDECWAVNAGIKDLYEADYGLIAPCKVRLNATDHRPVEDPQEAARIVNETFGVPVMISEFLIGRHTHANTISAYARLAPGSWWRIEGVAGVFVAFLILSYYVIISGWTLYYLVQSCTGALAAENGDLRRKFAGAD